MAQTVINNGEILLNNVKYPIEGQVKPRILSRFPSKSITGDYEYDNQEHLSNWIISDQRGGIGIEEMDDESGSDRCFFTDCITDYKGHIRLPRLASAATLDAAPVLSNSTFDTNANGWTGGTWGAAYGYSGGGIEKQAAGGLLGWQTLTLQALATPTAWRGKRLTASAKLAITAGGFGNGIRITITDDAGSTSSTGVLGAYAFKSVSRVIDAAATAVTIYIQIYDDNSNTTVGRADDIYVGRTTGGTYGFCNFNSRLYMWAGNCIYKDDGTGNAFDFVANLDSLITDVSSSLNSRMYIAVGDTINYWWMSTVDVFTQAATAAYWFLQWDSKLCKFLTDGTSFYSTDPDGGPATWTNYGVVTDIPSTAFKKPVVYQDAAGEDIIYWPTSVILKAHDAANTKYTDTKVKLSSHPNGARGCLYWQDGLFIPQGLQVKKYVVGGTASVSDVGLDRDDGLMAEYNGEIVKLVEGETEMFALVDASQSPGTTRSGLYAYNGDSWKCWWAESTAGDSAEFDAIVSTAFGYRLWFIYGTTPTINYITLLRGLKNPSQLSTVQTYAAAGIWISPWFNAGTSAFTKCLKQGVCYSQGVTTTETVTVKYRINKTNTDRDTGWTTLATLDAAGDNGLVETLVAAGVGLEYSCIQFRLDLARGATTTLTPDVQALTVSYLKNNDSLWGYDMTVSCGEFYANNTPRQLFDNLKTAVDSKTLVPFLYRDNSSQVKYVKIISFKGIQETGQEFKGRYSVSCIEP